VRGWLLPLEVLLARGQAPALAACMLLAVVLAAGVGVLARQHATERRLVAALDALRQQAMAERSGPSSVRKHGGSNEERLAEFEQALGARAQIDAHLRQLFDGARRRGLRLELGEYRLAADAAGGFQRYEIVLPIEGRFAAIQSFSQQVLLTLPFAALEDVAVRRDSVDSAVVEARLRFALYLRLQVPMEPEAAAPPTRKTSTP
jgi:hypothetical protein